MGPVGGLQLGLFRFGLQRRFCQHWIAAGDVHAGYIGMVLGDAPLPWFQHGSFACVPVSAAVSFLSRAARTLVFYLMETNLNVHHWLQGFIKANPIPRVRVNGDAPWRHVAACNFSLGHMPVEPYQRHCGIAWI